jgi:hypothetical protein
VALPGRRSAPWQKVKFDPIEFRYDGSMARGWESKSVEMQQEEAQRPGAKRDRAAIDPAVALRLESLRLARARVASELEKAKAPAHRAMLESALAAIDADIAAVRETQLK